MNPHNSLQNESSLYTHTILQDQCNKIDQLKNDHRLTLLNEYSNADLSTNMFSRQGGVDAISNFVEGNLDRTMNGADPQKR